MQGAIFRCMKKIISFYLLILFALLGGRQGFANDSGYDRFRISGYGTLGVAYGGRDQVGLQKDYYTQGQFGDVSLLKNSVFGLQLDANLFKNLSATVQVMAKDRPKYDFNNIVNWAYLKYRPISNIDIRAGRMGVDVFMLSEYRNVGYAYLWTQPVVEFYKPILLEHFDGVDIKYGNRIKPGYFEFKIYAGQTRSDILSSVGKGSLTMQPFAGFKASLETDYWTAHLAYATTLTTKQRTDFDQQTDFLRQIPHSIWPQASSLANHFSAEGKQTHYLTAGFSYDNSRWVAQSEFAWLKTKWLDTNMTNGYLSVGRRIGPVTLYTVGSFAYSGKKYRIDNSQISQPFIAAIANELEGIANIGRIDQNTVSVGARWDFYPRMALKAQWDHTWVREQGGGLQLLTAPLDHNIQVNTFSANLNIVF